MAVGHVPDDGMEKFGRRRPALTDKTNGNLKFGAGVCWISLGFSPVQPWTSLLNILDRALVSGFFFHLTRYSLQQIQKEEKKSENTGSHRTKKHYLHQPGIEPGSVPWQGTILPLDHWCFDVVCKIFLLLICTQKNFNQSTSTLKKSGHTAPSLIHYRARSTQQGFAEVLEKDLRTSCF